MPLSPLRRVFKPMERPERQNDQAMTGLASSSRRHSDPRKASAHGLTFKYWGGTLSGEGFGFRMARHQ